MTLAALVLGMCLQRIPEGISFKVLEITNKIVIAKFFDGSVGRVMIDNEENFKPVKCEI